MVSLTLVPPQAGGFERRLVRIPRAVLRVPSLCIHLQVPHSVGVPHPSTHPTPQSAEERGKFAPNKETHLQPVLAMVQVLRGVLSCRVVLSY